MRGRPIAAIVLTILALAGFVLFCVRVLPPVVEEGKPDFPNYYFGGQQFLEDGRMYQPLSPLVEEDFGVAYEAYSADPPATVILLSPLSLLPYSTAWVLFAVVSALVMFGVGYGTAREVGWRRSWAMAAAAVVLVTAAGRFVLQRNHMEFILMLTLFLGWRALRRRQQVHAGIWWGIAAALKLFPAFLIVGLVATRRKKAAIVAALTAAGITLAAVLVGGWDNTLAYVTDVVPLATQWYGALGNYSLLSFGTALAGSWLGWTLLVVVGGVLVVAYVGGVRSADDVWIAGMAAALLITPLSWLNYLVLVLPAVVVVIDKLDFGKVRERWLAIILAAILGFWWPIVLGGKLPSVLLSFLPTYALVALFITAIRRPWSKQLSYL